jgi:hypothetical protein
MESEANAQRKFSKEAFTRADFDLPGFKTKQ